MRVSRLNVSRISLTLIKRGDLFWEAGEMPKNRKFEVILGGRHGSSRCRIHEVVRHSHTLRLCDLGNGVTPARRNAAALPLVDGARVDSWIAKLCKSVGDGGAATKRGDEGGVIVDVCHTDKILHHVRFVKPDLSGERRDASGNRRCDNGGMVKKRDEYDPFAIKAGERLVLARRAIGFERLRDFAKDLDPDDFERAESTIGGYERGRTLIPPPLTHVLWERYGIPATWLYSGVRAHLPSDMRQRIEALERKVG